MPRKNLLLLTFSLFATVSLHAQMVRVLIPISVPSEVPGAYGTLWKSDLWIHNGLDRAMAFSCSGNVGPFPICDGINAGVTAQPSNGVLSLSKSGALLLYLNFQEGEDPRQANFSCRLFELSRHAQPAGVHIPVVRDGEFFQQPSRFIGISGSAANRVALRVYDPDAYKRDGAVRVDMIDSHGATIGSTTLPLQYFNVWSPGYAAIYDLAAAFPQLANADRYDVRVTPLTPGMEYWAMVSVTDIESQQVLLITAD
jgi:hypothetical protein